MDKLLVRLLGMGLLIIGTSFVIVFLSETGGHSDSYLAAALDKHNALRQVSSPKIIFVGGSNLAFGLDSTKIEKRFGLPVVNMGLHAGLGLRYMLEEVKPYIRKGDIVVIIPEYQQFYGFFNGSTELLEVLMVFPEGLNYIHSMGQYQALMRALPAILQGAPKREIANLLGSKNSGSRSVYTRSAFNVNGDVVVHLNQAPLDVSHIPLFTSKQPAFDPEPVQVLNEFTLYVKAMDARIFFMFPSVPEVQFRENEKILADLNTHLQRNLRMPILSSSEASVLPLDCFYDTVYHLNAKGLSIRMLQVITDLEQVQAREPF